MKWVAIGDYAFYVNDKLAEEYLDISNYTDEDINKKRDWCNRVENQAKKIIFLYVVTLNEE